MRVEDISEGTRRDAPRETTHLLNLAEASLEETEQLLRQSQEWTTFSPARINPLLARTDRIARMLSALKAAFRRTC